NLADAGGVTTMRLISHRVQIDHVAAEAITSVRPGRPIGPMRRFFILILLVVVAWLGSTSEAIATFPGSVGKVLFASASSGGLVDLSTQDADGGSPPTVVARDVVEGFGEALWSPDGTKIAYMGLGSD